MEKDREKLFKPTLLSLVLLRPKQSSFVCKEDYQTRLSGRSSRYILLQQNPDFKSEKHLEQFI